MTTFADLTIGTVVAYNDMANINVEFVILDKTKDQFGSWVNVLRKETNSIESMKAYTEIGKRWTIIAEA